MPGGPPSGEGPPGSYGMPPPYLSGGSYPPPPSYPAYPGGAPNPYPGGPMPPIPGGKTGVSGFAIAALVVAILVPCLGLFIAVPLAIAALVKIGKSQQRGKGLAIAAIVVAVLWVAAAVIWAVWIASQQADRNSDGVITKAGDIAYGDIEIGDCVIVPDPGGEEETDPNDLEGVPCDEKHNVEAVGSYVPLDGESDDYPGYDALGDDSLADCSKQVRPYLKANDNLILYRLIPNDDVWDTDGGDRVICFVADGDFADLTGPTSK